MARVVNTVQQIAIAGIAPSFSAGDQPNGHEFANDGNVYLEVKNTGGAPITVTIQAPAKFGGVSLTNPTVSVPATTGDRLIGPFPTRIFNQAAGTVYVDLSSSTGVMLAVFRLG